MEGSSLVFAHAAFSLRPRRHGCIPLWVAMNPIVPIRKLTRTVAFRMRREAQLAGG